MSAPAPKTVQISLAVQVEEMAAQYAYLHHRSLLQAQAIADLKADNAALQQANAELQRQLEAQAAPPVEPDPAEQEV